MTIFKKKEINLKSMFVYLLKNRKHKRTRFFLYFCSKKPRLRHKTLKSGNKKSFERKIEWSGMCIARDIRVCQGLNMRMTLVSLRVHYTKTIAKAISICRERNKSEDSLSLSLSLSLSESPLSLSVFFFLSLYS